MTRSAWLHHRDCPASGRHGCRRAVAPSRSASAGRVEPPGRLIAGQTARPFCLRPAALGHRPRRHVHHAPRRHAGRQDVHRSGRAEQDRADSRKSLMVVHGEARGRASSVDSRLAPGVGDETCLCQADPARRGEPTTATSRQPPDKHQFGCQVSARLVQGAACELSRKFRPTKRRLDKKTSLGREAGLRSSRGRSTERPGMAD